MNRAAVVYIVTLIACAAGLWLILRAGASLRAPLDLSGTWGVGGEDPNVPQVLGDKLEIEQSGRFVRLNFSRGMRVDLKLVGKFAPDAVSGRRLDMLFEGPRWKLSAFGAGTTGPLIFRLTGPEKHIFTATRGGAANGNTREISAHAPSPTETADVAGTDAP
jgi:hypothetical protein